EAVKSVGLGPGREVHLADGGGAVAGAGERGGERDDVFWKRHAGVAAHAERDGGTTAHKRVAGGDADGDRGVGVGKVGALEAQGVKAGSADGRMTGAGEEVAAELIRGNEEDVGRAFGRGSHDGKGY